MKQRPTHAPPTPPSSFTGNPKTTSSNNNNNSMSGHLLHFIEDSSQWVNTYCNLDDHLLILDNDKIDISISTISNCMPDEEKSWGRNNILKIERKHKVDVFSCETARELSEWMKALTVHSYATQNKNRMHFNNFSSLSPGISSNNNTFMMSSQPDIVVEPLSTADDELNDRYQKFMLREEFSLDQSVQNGLSLATYVGSFLSKAKHIAQVSFCILYL